MSTDESALDIAEELALTLARDRPDRNMVPVTKAVSIEGEPGNYFILVDVQYHTDGYQALYEYRCRDGRIVLAQD